ncbi:tetratricopeptide repeat protein [Paraburkholderia megapolitana]|uniref:tetratricopeptide repeat protein n=1 Tax=Paraburkholderia megapolitana TaxID=420953 RepID=UPI0038BB2401
MAFDTTLNLQVRLASCTVVALVLALLGACSAQGYGVGPQAERQAMMQQADRTPAPDTPGMYLGLIDRMQQQGLYFASLAHIDAYEKQYGVSPDTIVLRADALRMTDQPAASAASYTQLLQTPLAARGHRGLGLIAGESGDFPRAVQQLQQAAQLVPTDASTLSDLGYAELRTGDVSAARVPLMKAAQLEQSNQKIISNVVLFLLADGQSKQAQALMTQQKMSPDLRAAIRIDAAKVAAAQRVKQLDSPVPQAERTTGTVASVPRVSDTAPRLLQWFTQ